jgi:predicted transcriptional regulator
MKITDEQGQAIYRLASDPKTKITNSAIAAKFGISEASVRRIVKKQEAALHKIASNNQKMNTAIVNNKINVLEEGNLIIKVIKSKIQEAKNQGIAPHLVSSLIGNWLKALELMADMDILRRIEKLEQRKP